jgi:hypothetical protein
MNELLSLSSGSVLWICLLICTIGIIVVCRRRRGRNGAYGVDTARWLHAKLPPRRDVWFNFGDWSVRRDTFAEQCEAFVDALLVGAPRDTALRVLDIGCGASGAQSSYVYRVLSSRAQLERMVAVDPALDDRLLQRLPRTTFYRCGLQDVPFDDGGDRFNVVIAVDSLYHVPIARPALYRALALRFDPAAPHCWLAVTDLLALPQQQQQQWSWWRSLARSVLARLLRAPNLTCELSLADYAALLEGEHFVNVRVLDVTDVVLDPFAAYLDAQLERCDGVLAWHKAVQFRAFAALLRFALRHQLFAYVRVTAERATLK